jgi:DNA polymerase III epsilon subunit-like protein
MKLLCDYKLAIIDCETTGLNLRKHEIIELAVILYSQRKDKVLKKWCRKVKPLNIKTASKKALQINGYEKHTKEYTGDIFDTIVRFNKLVEGCILVGQNVSFDINFINKYLRKYKIKPLFGRRYVELMGLAWPQVRNHLENISLKDLCDHFNISNENAHSAFIDCERTLEVYRCLM